MSSALAVTDSQTHFTPEQLAALHQLGVEKASTGDLSLFLSYAQRTGLDPFSRQLYMIGRWDGKNRTTKWTIQTSIDGLRIIAQRSGEYEGQTRAEWFDGTQWVDVWTGSGPPVAARVGVYRARFREPLYAVAMWSEYQSDGPMWRKMPALMLSKTAEALALRKAFPNDMSGIYTSEEMAQAERTQPTVEAPKVPLSLDEIVGSAVMAVTEAELRACWMEARTADLLTADVDSPWNVGEVMTVQELISSAREILLQREPVIAEVDADTEPVISA